ncbi:hypothetical protein DAPPUDRAFT_315224 [Daphnia pulex]|uniref:Uncharacterized protein n=1 Tax=Daphnia pulex TaxID=6669 RepID=E9G945_DAPPU|nr:hypothetical protein DAPPUDRAFT_315224 [Daphnia pulex]|eukprot:EFX84161.1 hypothetical protein DAPPUDRAFT_315224 [Daphnia pulex]
MENICASANVEICGATRAYIHFRLVCFTPLDIAILITIRQKPVNPTTPGNKEDDGTFPRFATHQLTLSRSRRFCSLEAVIIEV